MPEIPGPIPHTVNAIYAEYEANARSGHSDGIPISHLAEECDRRLWYAFRWAFAPEQHEGRMLRLFKTGEREEERMLDDLRAIGCEVTGEQEKVRGCNEHLRGKLDGRVIGLPEAPKTEHVVECKTHNAKSFRAVVKSGVKDGKFSHWVQMQIYMHLTSLSRALYMAHCKDTDELYTERVEHDPVFCLRAIARAERIIAANDAPTKLHDDPTKKAAFACTFCPAKPVCHEGATAPRNCRTCMHSTPVEGGAWLCERHTFNPNRNEQQLGCPDHRFLLRLVPGEQVDYDPNGELVLYQLADGSEWIDGGANA
jgi:hypothetical protein